MSGKHSVWKRRSDGRTVRRNKISGQFAHQLIEMLESPAWRVLSLSARRVFDRIQIEHAHHGGRDNGRLPVTFKDFEDGLDRHSVRPAIAELDALGFIRITQHGRAGNADFRIPNKFRLTHQHANDGAEPATNEWRRFKTLEEAENIAKLARLVGGGTKQKKQKTSGGFSTSPRWKKSTSKPGFQGGKNPREKPHHYLYLHAVSQHLPGPRGSRRRSRTSCWSLRQRRRNIDAMFARCVPQARGHQISCIYKQYWLQMKRVGLSELQSLRELSGTDETINSRNGLKCRITLEIPKG
jgi:hypothetical protein